MSISQRKLSLFHQWLDENDVAIHPGVQVIDRPDSGIAVVASSHDKPILHPDRRRYSTHVLTFKRVHGEGLYADLLNLIQWQ